MNDDLKTQPGCGFCRSNNSLDGEVIAESANAYLIQAGTSPDNYLIIPNAHVESIAELADDWWKEVKWLLPKVPHLLPDYNLSLNIGRQSGQTMPHLHFWVISRAPGLPASGKGFARLISEANQ